MNETTPWRRTWPLERALFALGGSVILVSALLSLTVSRWFVLLAALVGVNEWLYVTARDCPTSILLKRACGLESTLYPAQSPTRRHSSITT